MQARAQNLTLRLAERIDVPAIIALLADDAISADRENTANVDAYEQAFDAIARDPNNELIVACLENAVVGVLQLTFIPSLSRMGSWRALIDAVRVASPLRSQGIGRRLLEWSIDRARQRGCRLIQLTTDKRRIDAKRFYESLGFVASHEGIKLMI